MNAGEKRFFWGPHKFALILLKISFKNDFKKNLQEFMYVDGGLLLVKS